LRQPAGGGATYRRADAAPLACHSALVLVGENENGSTTPTAAVSDEEAEEDGVLGSWVYVHQLRHDTPGAGGWDWSNTYRLPDCSPPQITHLIDSAFSWIFFPCDEARR
jgi:hypothetical protein